MNKIIPFIIWKNEYRNHLWNLFTIVNRKLNDNIHIFRNFKSIDFENFCQFLYEKSSKTSLLS